MNVQTGVENRLISALTAFNAALGTNLSFPPIQSDRMRKPETL
jgi:hypothetical protein